jgi:hypothetical protein
MATTSFERKFVVNDQRAIAAFMDNLSHPETATVNRSVSLGDSAVKGIELLKRKLHHSGR